MVRSAAEIGHVESLDSGYVGRGGRGADASFQVSLACGWGGWRVWRVWYFWSFSGTGGGRESVLLKCSRGPLLEGGLEGTRDDSILRIFCPFSSLPLPAHSYLFSLRAI